MLLWAKMYSVVQGTPGRSAEVVIVGGGIVGLSIAYHLAKAGCHDIVVFEKDQVGSGSTGKCPGGIRQQFSSEMNVRLSMESVRSYQALEEETGHPADFRQHGYLILASNEDEKEAFRRNVALQRRLGLKVDLLSPREAGEIAPYVNTDDIVAATFCPTDGYADPTSAVAGLASAARKRGVKIVEAAEVVGIQVRSGRVDGVVTSQGDVRSGAVVNAAGAYAGKVGEMAGFEVPVRPSRRHVFVTAPVDLGRVPGDAPMVIDFATGFWLRREGPGLIFGMRNPDEPEGFDISVDWGFLPRVSGMACRRAPFLGETGVVRAWAGLHEDTPDYNGILGQAPEVQGFYLACGFSGHGFMHAPAVGRLAAELVLLGKTSLDISAMSPSRFQPGLPRQTKAETGEKSFI